MDTLTKLCTKLRISLKEVAYIGDDINDLAVLKNVGAPACPSDAMDKVKEVSQYVCNLKGGQGCVREFIDKITLMFC